MARTNQLSLREKEVAELLLQGKSNKQIALGLGIVESMVEFHLKNIYSKLQVSSRAEAILKLGKSRGLISQDLRESVVDYADKKADNGGEFIVWKRWIGLIHDIVSMVKKELEMKNRLISYFLFGLIFGVLFWLYFNYGISWFVSRLGFVSRLSTNEENVLTIWAVLSIEFLLIFSVWLIPAIFPTVSEFRRSRKVSLSIIAVIVSWVSAVLSYYLTYVGMLAFLGLPHMEHYLIFGQRGPTFWQDWAELFPKLILYDFLQWTVVGIIIGGLSGLLPVLSIHSG